MNDTINTALSSAINSPANNDRWENEIKDFAGEHYESLSESEKSEILALIQNDFRAHHSH